MCNNTNIAVTLPGCISADCAVICNGKILASNGFNNSIFDLCLRCNIPTVRGYVFLSTSTTEDNLFAIASKCSDNIFVLNNSCEEVQSITPDIYSGPLQSVYMYPDESGLLLTYRKQCVKTNIYGRILNNVGYADTDNIDFLCVMPLINGFLMAFTENDQTVIKLLADNESSIILPDYYQFKSFVSDNNCTIYALLGRGYPKSFLVPVYRCGSLLPFHL